MRRRGHSLVELIVIMSAASTVLTISAVLIHRTMHLASRTRAFHAEEATAWRLSALLRSDAAGAESIDAASDDAQVTITLHDAKDEPVVYRFNGSQVERTQQLDADREARESFDLPSVAGWRAEPVDNSAALRIEATPSQLPLRSLAPISVSLVIHAAGGTP